MNYLYMAMAMALLLASTILAIGYMLGLTSGLAVLPLFSLGAYFSIKVTN